MEEMESLEQIRLCVINGVVYHLLMIDVSIFDDILGLEHCKFFGFYIDDESFCDYLEKIEVLQQQRQQQGGTNEQ